MRAVVGSNQALPITAVKSNAGPRLLMPKIIGVDALNPAYAFEQYVADLAAAGAKLNGQRAYRNTGQGTTQITQTQIDRHNGGAMDVYSLRFHSPYTWDQVPTHQLDAILDSIFDPLLALDYTSPGKPTNSIVLIDPEMGRLIGTNGSSAGAWAAAQRYAYARLRNKGGTHNDRVLMGFCDQSFWIRNRPADLAALWPGDDYIDLHCPDAYNKGLESPTWAEAQQRFEEWRNWTQVYKCGVGKLMLVVEGDCQDFGGHFSPLDPKYSSSNPNAVWPAGAPFDSMRKADWYRNRGAYIKVTPDAAGWIDWDDWYPPYSTPQARQGFIDGAVTAQS